MLTAPDAQTVSMNSVIASLAKFSGFSGHVIPQIIRLTSDESASARDLARVLAHHPSLTATVIRLANSSYYGRRCECTSIQEAVTFLGFFSVRSLTLAASMSSIFKNDDDSGIKEALWNHSLATAVGARLVTKMSLPRLAEEAFLAGLMHDLAKLVLLQDYPEEYTPILRGADGRNRSSLAREHFTFGIAHDQLGAMILEDWGLPRLVIEVVRYHHSPDDPALAGLPGDSQSVTQRLAHVVCFANSLAHASGYAVCKSEAADLSRIRSSEFLGYSSDMIESLQEELIHLVDQELSLFDH